MILNEISIGMGNISKDEIKMHISDFLKVCHGLNQKKKDEIFYYTDDLSVRHLCEGYTLHDWLKDPTVLKKEKDYFRRLWNSGKRIDRSQFPESELLIRINGEKLSVTGCLAAYEWNSYVVSLESDVLWQKDYILGEYYNLENEDINETEIRIRNCSRDEHVESIITEQKTKDKLLISSGIELWEKRKRLFPHLVFCESVKKQLEEARIDIHIQTILQRLQILEDYFAVYDGAFDKEKVGYGCRYESESVQKDERLKNMRRFKTPFEKEEYFYWHISFPGNYPGRIHFLPNPEHKIGMIGYVGKHLPTTKYPTI